MFFVNLRNSASLILDLNTRFIPSINLYWIFFFSTYHYCPTLPYNLFLNYNNKISKNFFKILPKTMKLNFIVWFIRKEYCYTKLKYSRTPGFDIVSGGVAAIFAGFLGFLVCEKFGFELLDSGDFYLIFMYLIFVAFSLRLWFRIFSFNDFTFFFKSFFIFFLFFFKKLVTPFFIFKKLKLF